MSGQNPKIVAASVLLTGFGILIIAWTWTPTISVDEQLRALRRHFLRGEHAEVVAVGEQLLAMKSLTDAGAVMSGESATRCERWEDATRFYEAVDVNSKDYLTAQFALGEVLRELGSISKAEHSYNIVLAQNPDDHIALSRTALLKMVTGRTSDAVVDLRKLLALQRISWTELCWLAAPNLGVDAAEYLNRCARTHPSDPAPVFGLVDISIRRGDFAQAAQWLEKIPANSGTNNRKRILQLEIELQTTLSPVLPEMTPELFELCLSNGKYNELFVLGAAFEANGQFRNAILCYAHCLQQTDHLAAMQHFLSVLAVERPDLDLSPIQRRTSILSRLDILAKSLQSPQLNVATAREVAVIMAKLGRQQESIAWATVTQQAGVPPVANGEASADISEIIRQCLEHDPTLNSTSVRNNKKHTSAPPSEEHSLPTDIILTDEAVTLGLDFTYFESSDETTEGRRMIEFTGGGVGILDLDNDTWPDVHFPQGANCPVDQRQRKWLDVIYRNERSERFVDITHLCGLIEDGFSQGVACGDFNNDGFTDAVVGNIGPNSYWINQGDGTFLELIDEVHAGSEWTTSCAIADINMDGLPDIFEVNYVTGKGFDSLICETSAGPRVCAPHVFSPSIDRLLLNNGDGSFTDATQLAGINFPGNGLGLVVTNLDDDPMLELFVANDGTPNALWDNIASAGEMPLFQETAVIRGVAVGSEGQAQACMGVAADDFNDDGTTDLFVTNYFNEPNALYLFNEQGIAVDAAQRTGIRKSSMQWLGFGAQSLDANADGWPDIFLVNGDLDDFAHEGRAFRMPPQLMINQQGENFIEQRQLAKDDVRSRPFRGRGVARCDWNHDQDWDLVISRLDDPAMLVTNSTAKNGFMMLTFVGTKSSRDAIGTKVSLAGNHNFRLDAGNGYMASNEKALRLPFNRELVVLWPGSENGNRIVMTTHSNNAVVEGRLMPYFLPE